jgi:hypothetical protein
MIMREMTYKEVLLDAIGIDYYAGQSISDAKQVSGISACFTLS